MKKCLLLCIFIIFSACASKPVAVTSGEPVDGVPLAKVPLTIPVTYDLETDGRNWSSLIANLRDDNCAEDLDVLLNSLRQLSHETYLKVDASKLLLTSTPRVYMNNLFQLRMRTKNKLQDFYGSNSLSTGCEERLLGVSEALRVLEESLGVHLYYKQDTRLADMATMKPQPVFTNSHFQLFANETLRNHLPLTSVSELRSGDILVTHETAPYRVVSAIVYKDEAENVYTVNIDGKSEVLPIQDWLKKEMVRASVFRFYDETIAQGAAAAAHQQISSGTGLEKNFLQNAFITSAKDAEISQIANDPRFQLLAEWKDYAAATIENLFARETSSVNPMNPVKSKPEDDFWSEQPFQSDIFRRNSPVIFKARNACFLVN